MFILSGHLLGYARDARDRAVSAVESNPDVIPSDTSVAIIMSAAATEGFINEVSEFTYRHRDKVAPKYVEFANQLKELENRHEPVKKKYLTASRLLSGKPFNEEEDPFQDFAALIDLRNAHMHLKSRDDFDFKDGKLINKEPDYVLILQSRGLFQRFESRNVRVSWMHAIQTADTAKWAVEAAQNIIDAVLDMTPDSNEFNRFKELFSFSSQASIIAGLSRTCIHE